MKSTKLLISIILCICSYNTNAQQITIDSVFLFRDSKGVMQEDTKKTHREIGSHIKHLQITNFAGKTVDIDLSLDLKQWNSFTLKSPEKKVFVCNQINSMFIIIEPKSKRPVKKKIYRNKKYELFKNDVLSLIDIMISERQD